MLDRLLAAFKLGKLGLKLKQLGALERVVGVGEECLGLFECVLGVLEALEGRKRPHLFDPGQESQALRIRRDLAMQGAGPCQHLSHGADAVQRLA